MAINFSASFAACLAAGLKVPRQIMYCIAQGKNKFFDKWHLYQECESVRCTLRHMNLIAHMAFPNFRFWSVCYSVAYSIFILIFAFFSATLHPVHQL
jgi:hypothetical protein